MSGELRRRLLGLDITSGWPKITTLTDQKRRQSLLPGGYVADQLKTIREACFPRTEIHDAKLADWVLQIGRFSSGEYRPDWFFERTVVTKAIEELYSKVERRLATGSGNGVFVLSESMGGGKTHVLVALGLLARHPEWRSRLFANTPASGLGAVKTLTFDGRQTDQVFWQEIARQAAITDPRLASITPPGPDTWVAVLKGQGPLLILVDELPAFFFGTGKTASGDISMPTATGIVNLYQAISAGDLPNVCVVQTDLRSSSFIQGKEARDLDKMIMDLPAVVFMNNEVSSRLAELVRPISGGAEFAEILRLRLFESIDTSAEPAVTAAYAQALRDADRDDDVAALQLRDRWASSYPFHPALFEALSRIEKAAGFQQTRGILRLLAGAVSDAFTSSSSELGSALLIGPSELDPNVARVRGEFDRINNELTGAIEKDVANGGQAAAEVIDASADAAHPTAARAVARLVFLASLAPTGQKPGFSVAEIGAYVASPARSGDAISNALSDLERDATYLHVEAKGESIGPESRLFFRPQQNIRAAIYARKGRVGDDDAKDIVRSLLLDALKLNDGQVFRNVDIFKTPDQLRFTPGDRTLIVTWPGAAGDDENERLYRSLASERGNSVLFLTGEPGQEGRLLETAKLVYAARQHLTELLREKGEEARDPEVDQTRGVLSKAEADLGLATRNCFFRLFYPLAGKLQSQDMELGGSTALHGRIRNLLEARAKWQADAAAADSAKGLRVKIEQLIFGAKAGQSGQAVPESDIRRRLAADPAFVWGPPGSYEQLRDELVRRQLWTKTADGFVGVATREAPKPSAVISGETTYSGDKATFRLQLSHADRVSVRTGEDDSRQELKAGPDGSVMISTDQARVSWTAYDSTTDQRGTEQVEIVPVEISLIQQDDHVTLTLIPEAPLKLSFDDKIDPRTTAATITERRIKLPTGCSLVRASAAGQPPRDFPLAGAKRRIDPAKRYQIPTLTANTTAEAFEQLEAANRYRATLRKAAWRVSLPSGRSLQFLIDHFDLSAPAATDQLSALLALVGDGAAVGSSSMIFVVGGADLAEADRAGGLFAAARADEVDG